MDERHASNALFISWISYHGRSEGIARHLGIREWSDRGGRGPALIRYVRLFFRTWRVLRAIRPDAVIVMQPPIVALWTIKLLGGRRLRVCGDLHSGVFDDPRWTWSTKLTLRALRGKHCALVTNEALAERVRAAGVEAIVLHDLLEDSDDQSAEEHGAGALQTALGKHSIREQPIILVPLSYSYDEPLDALSSATHGAVGATWVFTGEAPRVFISACASENVVFTGFVSRHEYQQVFRRADVIVAPTAAENTMQRAGYEAMNEGKSLVTTSTVALRGFFEDAAVLVEPTADGVLAGVRDALSRATELQERMRGQHAKRMMEQDSAFAQLREWVGGTERGLRDGMATQHNRQSMLGMPIDTLTMSESVGRCHELVEERGHYRVDINAAIAVKAQSNLLLRECLQSSSLANADGQSIVWAGRLLGVHVPERVPGIDLFLRLLEHAPDRGDRVYFLGAHEQTVSAIAHKFTKRGVNVVGFMNGYWPARDEASVVQRIAEARPDILFIGLPSPAKEEFIQRHLKELNTGLAFGVGGAFDVVAGKFTRAPKWMQRSGLEWLHRLAQEPRRLVKRYLLGNTQFILLVAQSIVKRRRKPRGRGGSGEFE